MDLRAWLRSLGLERYEAAFRENAIAPDILRDLTDQDLEKLGVLLGDRRRLLRAIAALDEAPAPPTSPVPAPSSAAAVSPISAEVEVSGERPNVVTLRANPPALLKSDVASEGLALDNAIRQVTTETSQSRTGSRAETRARPPSAAPPGARARQDRANTPQPNLLGEGWHDALLSARQRLLKGRAAAKAATTLRDDVVEGDDLRAATVKAPQVASPPHDTYEPEAGAATEKAPQAIRPPAETSEPEPGTATAKTPQDARPRRDPYEPEAGAATAKAPPARPLLETYEPEAGAVTAKVSRPARPPPDSREPAERAATAKGADSARVLRDSYESKARTASTKAPQPTRLPLNSYQPKVRSAAGNTPPAARPLRNSYQPEPGAAAVKAPRAVRPPRDPYEPEELRHRPVIESAPTFPELEPDLEEEDLDSADYDTQHEHDLEPAYGRNDEQRVAAPPATHARRRTSRNEEHKRKRASLSYLTRLLVVLLILAGLVAAVSWQWSTVADLYQFLGRKGQLPSQVSGDNPSAKPEFWPRVPQEQASGQAPGLTAAGGQTVPAVASLIEADPSDPKGKHYVGSVIWRTEMVSAAVGVAPELAVQADIEIPERRMTMTWSIRRNTDKTLPATHTIEMTFNLPADFSGGSIANVAAIVMKQSEEARGNKLVTRVAKVTNGFFLIGLSAVDADAQRDTQLLKDRPWFDIGIIYTNGNQAILALEKGESGNRAFAQAFAAWDKK